MMSKVVLGRSFALAVLVATGCSSGSGGGGTPDAGNSGSGGSTVGGTGGVGVGGVGGSAGGTGGIAGGSAGAPTGGASGAAGTATGGAPPMCATSAECGPADVSFPGNTESPVASPTECAGGRCGLVTSYSGSYESPKQPVSCTEICAASTYEGAPMVCSPQCSKVVYNGFGDEALVFGDAIDGGTGAGSLAGLARFQFSPISGAFQFEEVSCSEVPPKKLIKGSNSYTYVSHGCCCVAP